MDFDPMSSNVYLSFALLHLCAIFVERERPNGHCRNDVVGNFFGTLVQKLIARDCINFRTNGFLMKS
jgi:hypothetical protein